MEGMKKYHIQIPEKIAEILPRWEGSPPFKGFHIDDLRLILSIISTHQRKDDKGVVYAQLVMSYLRHIVWNADKYIHFLINKEIIKTLGGYTPGVSAYKYQFTANYQSPYTKTELNNQKLLRRINRLRAVEGRKNSRQYPKQNQLIKSMTIDIEVAIGLVIKEFTGDIDRLNCALASITRIENKEFYMTVDKYGNRLHTNLTSLVKELRGQVMIRGKYLSGVDIRNSQPYISTKYLTDPEATKEFFPGQFHLMMLKSLRLSEQQDVKRFLLLTSKAQFYKYLETEFNKGGCDYKIQENPDKVSQELKDKVFQIFFDKNNHTSKEKRIFQRLFPNVDKAFSVLRMDNYKNFNSGLTRMESHLILDVILERLTNEYPGMVATQIYDNVTTSIATNDIKTVCRVMSEELTEFIGLPPVLKVENFDRPQKSISNLLELTKKETKDKSKSKSKSKREREEEGGCSTPL